MLPVRWIISLVATTFMLGGSPAMAQQAQGLWIGTLEIDAQTSLRVVVEITRNADGSLSGTLDSPDQNTFELPLADVQSDGQADPPQDGARLSFLLPAIGASMESEWSPASGGWLGQWQQAGASWPLLLTALDPIERPQPVGLPANWQIPEDGYVSALLDKRIAARPGAAIVLGIFDDGARHIRHSSAQGSAAFDGEAVFEIGSLTKVFTALLMADMALKGEISLDDRVAQYLPQGATMPQRNGQEITLRHLSLQTSGLPRLPDNMPFGDPQDPYVDYTEAMLLEFLGRYQLPRDIGASYEYSNLGVGLLGYVLARAADDDYGALLRERILDPLGMGDTSIALPPSMQDRFPTPHDAYMRPTKPWHIPTLAGAGALRSTASDMLTFLAAAMDPQSPIADAMALTLSERIDQSGADNTSAFGWLITDAPGGEVLHHGGGTGGFSSYMAAQPDRNRAVVGLTNAIVEPSVSDLTLHALIGMPLAHEIPIPPAPAAMPERVEIALSPAQLDQVVGRYRLPNGAEMQIVREGAQLFAQITSQPSFPIFAMAQGEFFWRVVDARVVFTQEGGAATGATLFQNGAAIPMERIE